MSAGVHETAYPRLPSSRSAADIVGAYTPTADELAYVQGIGKPVARAALLIQLKLFQRLGYFMPTAKVPADIRAFLATAAACRRCPTQAQFAAYDRSGSRQRHIIQLRAFFGVRPIDAKGTRWLLGIAELAAQTKEAVADIINVMLEELVRASYELPAFDTLARLAAKVRETHNRMLYQRVNARLTRTHRTAIEDLLLAPSGTDTGGWQALKSEPKRPTNKAIRAYLQQVRWRQSLADALPDTDGLDIPPMKRRQWLVEARALDVAEMRRLSAPKRYALATLFIRAQVGKALDDVADLLIRMVRVLENQAQQRLEQYQREHRARTDRLVETLRDILDAVAHDGAEEDRWQAVQAALPDDRDGLHIACDEHLAYSGNNYLPFLLTPYRAKRALLFNCLELLDLRSTSEDVSTLDWIGRIQRLRNNRVETLELSALGMKSPDDLLWLPDRWRKLVIVKRDSGRALQLHRKFLELAVLTRVRRELQSGDLAIDHGDRFDDYREHLISTKELEAERAAYGEQVGIETDARTFTKGLKRWLLDVTAQVDAQFPDNTHVTIENDRLVMRRPPRTETTLAQQRLNDDVQRRLSRTSIVDVLIDAEHWLDLHRLLKPLSGQASRVEQPRLRFITTLFCYGCNLGPMQTARSIKGFSRRQIAWLNLKQATEEQLDKVIVSVINAYNRFELPRHWGSGKHASADGTKWDLYEQNLLSEYHIRYGGYGGIGYYHVSDKYIALFSHFIPCGVHEAIYLLDGLMRNASNIQPEIIHGDTHAQSYPVFGLAHLLGIELMPRIRNVNDLVFHCADKRVRYPHIGSLFGGSIDWPLIERHFPDMLRVAISIKLGRISPSAILRRLGTYSRKNKLYFAFRELGKVVRTGFLLRYLSDIELRQMIHAATNKSEEFNGFAKWIFFGGEGIIAENVRHEQRKIIKYNHLVANLVILYNVVHMSRALNELHTEGVDIRPQLLAGLSPYRTSHINRFGDYTLDLAREVSPMENYLRPAE